MWTLSCCLKLLLTESASCDSFREETPNLSYLSVQLAFDFPSVWRRFAAEVECFRR